MIVNPKKLNTGNQAGYKYSEDAERALMKFVFGGGTVTEGYNNKYDAVAPNGDKIEIKFTNRSDIFIEESYADGTPSGIDVTEADYYLIVQSGEYRGKKIGKVKLIPVRDIIEIAPYCERKAYEPYSGSPGSKGFILRQELGNNDGWLGNIAFNDEDSKYPTGYVLNYWTYKTPFGKKIIP